MSHNGVIYMASLEAVGGKCYIGQTMNFERRQRQHLMAQTQSVFHRAVRKYGAENIVWIILERNIPHENISDREIYWIAYYGTFESGYNMTDGGEESYTMHPEVRQKLSKTRQEMVASGNYHTQTKEWSEKMSKIWLDKSARGEHPAQQQSTREAMSKGTTMTHLNRKVQDGQRYFLDMGEMDDTPEVQTYEDAESSVSVPTSIPSVDRPKIVVGQVVMPFCDDNVVFEILPSSDPIYQKRRSQRYCQRPEVKERKRLWARENKKF